MSYWGTSALAKLFVAEPDSTLFERHAAESAAPVVTAEITVLEMRRVAYRKEVAGVLQAGTAEATLADLDADVAAGSIRVVEQSAIVQKAFDQVPVILVVGETRALPGAGEVRDTPADEGVHRLATLQQRRYRIWHPCRDARAGGRRSHRGCARLLA